MAISANLKCAESTGIAWVAPKYPFGKYKETASVEFFYLEDEDRAYK